MAKLHAFTKNCDDESTSEGFQFRFLCDNCGEGYESEFVESKSSNAKERLTLVSKGLDFFGARKTSDGIDIIASQDRSAEWEKEHDVAFKDASDEAMGYFTQCPKCKSFVCETCFNDDRGLCVDCAPLIGIEMSAAKASAEVQQMREQVGEMEIFSGDTSDRVTTCPKCGKPAGSGKFCTNCGTSLGTVTCSKCGASIGADQKFCGNCGKSL